MTLNRGNYGWKFNSLLLKDDVFKNECKKDFLDTIENFDENSNPHIKWEYLKYQSSKFAILFSKRNKNSNFWSKNIMKMLSLNMRQQQISHQKKFTTRGNCFMKISLKIVLRAPFFFKMWLVWKWWKIDKILPQSWKKEGFEWHCKKISYRTRK